MWSVLVAAALVAAGEEAPAEKPRHPQLERMKKLAGEWLLVGADGQPTATIGASYRVTSGGSAVLETLFPGKDSEMVTMYYLDGGELVLTHYCCLANQPRMKADQGSAEGTIAFKFAGGSNIDPARDAHMHEAVQTFVDDDHLKSTWTMWEGGKAAETNTFTLARKR
jgi:hypothetical protein